VFQEKARPTVVPVNKSDSQISPSKAVPSVDVFAFGVVFPDYGRIYKSYIYTHTWLLRIEKYIDTLRFQEHPGGNRPTSMFEMLLDFIYTTHTFPPISLNPKAEKPYYRYVFSDKPNGEHVVGQYIPWITLLNTFTDSIRMLQFLTFTQILPGVSENRNVDVFYHPSGNKLRLKSLDRCVKLRSPKQVASWIESNCSKLTHPAAITKAPVFPFALDNNVVLPLCDVQGEFVDPRRIFNNLATLRRQGYKKTKPSLCQFVRK
jgi:hypothetical protein